MQMKLRLFTETILDIKGFFGPYCWLSNYHLVDIIFEDQVYKSTEHAYMASKTLDPYARRAIQACATPKEAKQLGRRVKLRPHWDEIKYDFMLQITRQKYDNSECRALLLATGDAYLEETNTWGDVYWGVCNGVGENNLGKIIMQVRDEINGSLA
jgi:N-glycosidase YbiA